MFIFKSSSLEQFSHASSILVFLRDHISQRGCGGPDFRPHPTRGLCRGSFFRGRDRGFFPSPGQWRSQLIDCPGTVHITEIFPLYLKCCSFYQDHSILFAQEVCPGNQLAGYATEAGCVVTIECAIYLTHITV